MTSAPGVATHDASLLSLERPCFAKALKAAVTRPATQRTATQRGRASEQGWRGRSRHRLSSTRPSLSLAGARTAASRVAAHHAMPRRSARLAAAAEATQPSAALQPLPLPLTQRIFTLLPVDSRARAACVSRAWRDALADPSLWTRLDLSETSGVVRRIDDDVLRAAAARAHGRLEVLDMGKRAWAAAREVVAENAASLRELRWLCFQDYTWESDWHRDKTEDGVAELGAALEATPNLRVLEAQVVTCGWKTARRLLHNEPPFGALRLQHLDVDLESADRDVAALVADIAARSVHHPLKALTLSCSDRIPLTPDELNTIVTAVLATGLPTLQLCQCCLTPAATPALVRLLGCTALTRLHIEQTEPCMVLLDEDSVVLFANGLRANRTLLHLAINGVVWYFPGLAEMVNALVAHPSLRVLDYESNDITENASEAERAVASRAAGVALGALIAANAPLEELHMQFCDLGDEGLGPLCDALPRNTRLHTLDISSNGITHAFTAQHLLPAVRANTSLRHLTVIHSYEAWNPAAHEAMALVASRRKSTL